MDEAHGLLGAPARLWPGSPVLSTARRTITACPGVRDARTNTEASLNRFPSSKIADRIQEDPYRFLVCADKFQTGYDEPLLHTVYVDKPLSGIKRCRRCRGFRSRTGRSSPCPSPGAAS